MVADRSREGQGNEQDFDESGECLLRYLGSVCYCQLLDRRPHDFELGVYTGRAERFSCSQHRRISAEACKLLAILGWDVGRCGENGVDRFRDRRPDLASAHLTTPPFATMRFLHASSSS